MRDNAEYNDVAISSLLRWTLVFLKGLHSLVNFRLKWQRNEDI